jgi:eukaryotic-like serine/threonine-protein kinase
VTSTRWQQVERLYHEAMGRAPDARAAFLLDACGGDVELQREIESLLAQEIGSDAFLNGAAVDAAARLMSGEHTTMIGRQIGVYRVLSQLGAGGMGEVYRARDTKLGRDVAIKVLPAMFTADRDRLARFEREARMLATLNHPHIGAIYGLEDLSIAPEQEPIRALILELVEGDTLADLIAARASRAAGRGRRLPIEQSVDIARQIAEALDAAHEKGIVHRDLKPANIKITPDAKVKVLDFGLAKAVMLEGSAVNPMQASTMSAGGTHEGAILGTASYMSPEQARGKPIDRRTDIWAFGCVLYEMLTGRPAFPGDTISDTIAGILEREPDWTALPAGLSRETDRLLRRCLEKDVKRRVRDIGDVAADLAIAPALTETRTSTVDRRRRWIGWSLTAAAGIGIVTTAFFLWPGAGSQSPDRIAAARVERITYDAGVSTMPAISPDGRLIAYASNRAAGGDLDIWVQQATGTPLRITDDPSDDVTPDFSPDGTQIVFRSERGGGGIYIAPALGGTARLIAAEGRQPRFSPDGTRVVYWSGQWRGAPSSGASALFVISLQGGSPSRLLAHFVMARDAVWSPDGRSLIVLARRDRESSLADGFDWWWLPLDGRPPVKTGMMAFADFIDGQPPPAAWTGSGVVFASQGDLWSTPISEVDGHAGAPRRLTVAAGASAPAVARDGSLVFALNQRHRVVERAPIAPGEEARPPVRLYRDNRDVPERASQTADGSMIVVEKGFHAHREIWLKRFPSGAERMITRADAKNIMSATTSPDGTRVVFTVGLYGEGSGRVVDVAGGVPRTLCDSCVLTGFLSDNRRVLAMRDQGRELSLVDTLNAAVTPLIRDPRGRLERSHASPDDRWLAFRRVVDGSAKTYLTALNRGARVFPEAAAEIHEPTVTGRPAGWSPDSRILYLLLDADGFRCLWGQRISQNGGLEGAPYAVRHFHHQDNMGLSTSYGNAITAEGFMYDAVEITGDVWRLVGALPPDRP